MNALQFPGARWWKFDFHTHTPKSMDFNDKTMTPETWLKAFMEKEIDCVAITDHNSGEWVDILKHELKNKEVREAICNILEGGKRAFEQRYKRIHLGD